MIELDTLQRTIAHEPHSSRQLIMAGPGRGKTELVAQRILHLMDEGGLNPSELIVLSFSRSAVRTLSNRLRSLDPESPGLVESLRHMSIRTFDSWTYRMLRFLGHTISDCLGRGYDANIEMFTRILKDDGLEILQNSHICGLHKIKHIVVDEVQDLSGVRSVFVLALLELICSSARRKRGFTLLGDENQAIYDFAYRESNKGLTSLEFLERIRQKWEQSLIERELATNYRSDPSVDTVITEAAEVLRRSRARSESPFPALHKLLNKIHSTATISAMDQLPDDIASTTAVLCRNNGQALIQASQLLSESGTDMARRLKVHSAGAPARLPSWIGSLLSMYMGQAPLSRSSVDSLCKALDKRGIHLPYNADRLWTMLTNIMGGSDSSSISMDRLVDRLRWPDSLPDDEYEDENGLVLLTTIHQAKGQEFDHVVVLRDGIAADVVDGHDADEEGRIAYVAISRARSGLSCVTDDSGVRLGKRVFDRRKRQRWYGNDNTNDGTTSYLKYLEIGLGGDVDEESFVDQGFHGAQEKVRDLQRFLADNASHLRGERILLKKRSVKGGNGWRVYYDIHLSSSEDGILLGSCTEQLSKDLLCLKNPRPELKLPRDIHGLRISQVFTHVSHRSDRSHLTEPFSRSGIWLCVSIHGIGQYEYYWYRKKGRD